MDDFEAFALRKAAHSIAAFGPRQTDEGILDHLKKEIEEVRSAERPKEKQREWVDIFMLGLDGLLRSLIREGYSTTRAAAEAVHMIRTKQTALEMREWPDWRTVAPDKAIEHVREVEEKTGAQCALCDASGPDVALAWTLKHKKWLCRTCEQIIATAPDGLHAAPPPRAPD
jgi:hypothetical protein